MARPYSPALAETHQTGHVYVTFDDSVTVPSKISAGPSKHEWDHRKFSTSIKLGPGKVPLTPFTFCAVDCTLFVHLTGVTAGGCHVEFSADSLGQ